MPAGLTAVCASGGQFCFSAWLVCSSTHVNNTQKVAASHLASVLSSDGSLLVPCDAICAAASCEIHPECLFVIVKTYHKKIKGEELEGLCAFQASVHALTVKGRCHCWVTLSSREAGLVGVVVGVGGVGSAHCLSVQIPINLPTGISI